MSALRRVSLSYYSDQRRLANLIKNQLSKALYTALMAINKNEESKRDERIETGQAHDVGGGGGGGRG